MIEHHPLPQHPASAGRSIITLTALLAAFIAMPWLVRPLEYVLSPMDVTLIGQLLETVLGVLLGVWVFRLIRRQNVLALAHARELEDVTEFDSLTGLGNRRALSRELELTLNRARRSREPVTVLYFDVIAMDDVNRRHGRAVGDHTLRVMGAVMRSSVRFGLDSSFRLEDDDFALVLAADREAAQTVRRRLEWNFQQRTARRSQLSVGLAAWDGCKSPEGLLEEARHSLGAQRQMAMVAQMA